MSAIRWKGVPVVGWLVPWIIYIGGVFWVSAALTGVFTLGVYLLAVAKILQNPPSLPNLPDMKACGAILLNTHPNVPFPFSLQFFQEFWAMFSGLH